MTKRPPLSSILDDKIDVYSNGSGGNENLYSNSTPAGPLAMERNDYASTDFPSTEDRVSRGATNKDFPLFPSSTLRSEIFGNSNTDVERVNSSFVSPTPVRPPLRSMMDSFSVDRNSTTDRLNEFTPSGARGAVGQQQRGGGGAEGMRSPVLALGPYTPSLDRLVRICVVFFVLFLKDL